MAAPVLHRLVIRHPRQAAVLVARHGEGWRLPEVELEERHTAEVEHVNAAVLARFGLHTTVRRALDHSSTPTGTRRTHELEAHDLGDDGLSSDLPVPPLGEGPASGAPPAESRAGSAWVTAAQLATLDLDRGDAALVRAYLNAPLATGEAWMGPGWWPAVQAWIEGHIGPAEVVQTRAWESSCVARVQQGRARFFFKAMPIGAKRETGVTAYLAARAAPGAPDVVAADLDRCWLLMRAFAGTSLDDVREPSAWARAAATYGRLQAATIGHTDDLRRLGCVERRLEDLAAAIEPLLADTGALMPGHAEGLAPQQIDALRLLAPELRRHCETLAAANLPVCLDHGDLWPSNLLVDEGECLVIDWEDAGINQPFLSLAPLVAMRREWGVELDLEQLAQAYLSPFAGLRPLPDLRRAFDAALPLGHFEMATRYWRMPAGVADLHPWMRETVPFFLRHLLEGWAAG